MTAATRIRVQMTHEKRWANVELALMESSPSGKLLRYPEGFACKIEGADELAKTYGLTNWETALMSGAFYAFPSIKKWSNNSREFAAMILEKALVATVPGIVFGSEGEGHLRFSYSLPIETIQAGLVALKKVL